MSDKSTGRESDKFMLRLPEGMRERIAELAKANNRSMNAEIVARLEASLAPDGFAAILNVGLEGKKKAEVVADSIVAKVVSHMEHTLAERSKAMRAEILAELKGEIGQAG